MKQQILHPGEVYALQEKETGKWFTFQILQRSSIMTDKYQLWIEEKRQLIDYASENGCLPPGNKLFK